MSHTFAILNRTSCANDIRCVAPIKTHTLTPHLTHAVCNLMDSFYIPSYFFPPEVNN